MNMSFSRSSSICGSLRKPNLHFAFECLSGRSFSDEIFSNKIFSNKIFSNKITSLSESPLSEALHGITVAISVS